MAFSFPLSETTGTYCVEQHVPAAIHVLERLI